jgi:hypothetical protein
MELVNRHDNNIDRAATFFNVTLSNYQPRIDRSQICRTFPSPRRRGPGRGVRSLGNVAVYGCAQGILFGRAGVLNMGKGWHNEQEDARSQRLKVIPILTDNRHIPVFGWSGRPADRSPSAASRMCRFILRTGIRRRRKPSPTLSPCRFLPFPDGSTYGFNLTKDQCLCGSLRPYG